MRKINGFTLIELIIGIAIIGLISALAVPNIRIIFDTKLKTEARTLLSDIRFVKDCTSATGLEYKITFQKDGYIITAESLGQLKNHKFSRGIYLEDYELNRGPLTVNYLTYTFDGAPTASGTLILSNSNKKTKISVVPVTGRAAITE